MRKSEIVTDGTLAAYGTFARTYGSTDVSGLPSGSSDPFDSDNW
nr:hypothetical protein [uncultured Prevotella sp.]